MAISPMQKVEIFGHQSEKEEVLLTLQETGVVEIQDFSELYKDTEFEVFASGETSKVDEIEELLAKIRFSIKYLLRFAPKKGLLEKFSGNRLALSSKEYTQIIKEFDYNKVIDICYSLNQKESELKTRLEQIQRERAKILHWLDMDVPVERINETEKTIIKTFLLRRGIYEKLVSALEEVTDCFHIEVVQHGDSNDAVLLVFLKDEEETIQSVLANIEYSDVSWEGYEGTPATIISSMDKEIEKILNEKEAVKREASSIVSERNKLLILEEHLVNELERFRVEPRFAETEKAFMLEGWTREEDFPLLQQKIKNQFKTVAVLKATPLEGEKPPVYLENSKFSEPFEMVTDLYGSPSYFELDPTPLLAPFFILFLGMCLTDAGYGFVVSLLSFIVLKTMRLGKGSKRMFSIAFYSGLATIVVGAMTGGYFGLDFSGFSPGLQAIREKLLLFDPLKGSGSLVFLGVCMGVGFVHIIFGLFVAFYKSVIKGKLIDGILDQLSWIFLLSGLLLLGLGKSNVFTEEVGNIGKWIALIAAGIVVLFSGRANKNPIVRIGAGLYALYGITGYFGDILSYSRLMAMGMATGVIAMVINTMTGMVKGIPFVGYFFAALFFVFGHVFNILINMVSGFIHTMRLQFVEFFGKFLEGGGRPFKPLEKRYRYSILVNLNKKEDVTCGD